MSFHGIPQPYADKGDPYADRCRVTGRLVQSARFRMKINMKSVSNRVLVSKIGETLY